MSSKLSLKHVPLAAYRLKQKKGSKEDEILFGASHKLRTRLIEFPNESIVYENNHEIINIYILSWTNYMTDLEIRLAMLRL